MQDSTEQQVANQYRNNVSMHNCTCLDCTAHREAESGLRVGDVIHHNGEMHKIDSVKRYEDGSTFLALRDVDMVDPTPWIPMDDDIAFDQVEYGGPGTDLTYDEYLKRSDVRTLITGQTPAAISLPPEPLDIKFTLDLETGHITQGDGPHAPRPRYGWQG